MAAGWASKGAKSTIVDADEVLIIDSEDANNATKDKRVAFTTLSAGTRAQNVKYVFTAADFPALVDIGGTDMHPLEDGFEYIIAAPVSISDPLFIDAGFRITITAFSKETNTLTYTGSGAVIRDRDANAGFSGVVDDGGELQFAATNTLGLAVNDLVNITSFTGATYTETKAVVTSFVDNVSFNIAGTFTETSSGVIDRNPSLLELYEIRIIGTGSNDLLNLNYGISEFTELYMFHVQVEDFASLGIVDDAIFNIIELNEFIRVEGELFLNGSESMIINGNKWFETVSGSSTSNITIGGLVRHANIINNEFLTADAGDGAVLLIGTGPGSIDPASTVVVTNNIDQRDGSDTIFDTSGSGIDERDIRVTVKHNVDQRDSGLEIAVDNATNSVSMLKPFINTVKLSTPNTAPSNNVPSITFSPNGRFMAVVENTSPYNVIYERNGSSYTKLGTLTLSGIANGVAWSPDGKLLAFATATSPFVDVFKVEGRNFTEITDTGDPPLAIANDVAFSPDGLLLAIAYETSPFIGMYDMSGGVFNSSLIDPTSGNPTGNGNSVEFSPNGENLTIGHETNAFVTNYTVKGLTIAKHGTFSTPPDGAVNGVAWSPNSEYLATAHNTNDHLTVYRLSGSTFTKLDDPSSLPAGTGNDADFSPDGRFLAIAHTSSPHLELYQIDGDVLTNVGFHIVPGNDGLSVAFSPDNKHLAIGHQGDVFLSIYETQGESPKQGGVISTSIDEG